MGILMEGFHIWMAGGYPKLAGFGKIPKWMMNDDDLGVAPFMETPKYPGL